MINVNDRVIKNLKYLMLKNNLNQNKLAKILCQSRQSISYYFMRQRNIPLKKIEKLSNIFNVKIEDFLK